MQTCSSVILPLYLAGLSTWSAGPRRRLVLVWSTRLMAQVVHDDDDVTCQAVFPTEQGAFIRNREMQPSSLERPCGAVSCEI